LWQIENRNRKSKKKKKKIFFCVFSCERVSIMMMMRQRCRRKVKLPDELLLLVFRYLNWRDLLSTMRVCRRWYRVSTDAQLWLPQIVASFSFQIPSTSVLLSHHAPHVLFARLQMWVDRAELESYDDLLAPLGRAKRKQMRLQQREHERRCDAVEKKQCTFATEKEKETVGCCAPVKCERERRRHESDSVTTLDVVHRCAELTLGLLSLLLCMSLLYIVVDMATMS
jgi:F-box-like